MTNEKYKKSIIDIFLIVGIFQVFYGLLQVYTDFSFIKHYSKEYMAIGLCGNPNFFGSYIILQIMLTSFLYLTTNKKRYLLATILFFTGLVLAGSTGPFLSFIIAMIFGIICFHKKINFKRVIILFVSLIITFFITNYSLAYRYNKPNTNGIDRNYNISTEIIDTVINKNKTIETVGNGRIEVWKKTLPLVKKYWVIGAGLDNFAKVYPNSGNIVFDKAHNVYLQIAVTNGSIVLFIYCLICFIAFIKGFKYKDEFYIAIYMSFVGYCIQAFANINVIDVTPCFYIMLGILYSKNIQIGSDNNGTLL